MSITDGGDNASTGAGQTAAASARRITITAQYIKDLSFENPGAPASLLQREPPELQINIDVNANAVTPGLYEVVLAIRATARAPKGETLFMLELAYAATVSLANVSENDAPEALLVETPRLIFPFARALVAGMTGDGGYPPVFLPMIDFSELMRRRQAAAAKPPA